MTTESLSTESVDASAQLLVAVAARLSRLHAKVLRNLDIPLTFRQHRTLNRVLGGCTSLSQLAALANLTIPTVSEGVDGLVRRGLMETHTSPTDRRAIVLGVTEAGGAAAAAGDLVLRKVAVTVASDLSECQHALFTESLQIVYEGATTYFREHFEGKR